MKFLIAGALLGFISVVNGMKTEKHQAPTKRRFHRFGKSQNFEHDNVNHKKWGALNLPESTSDINERLYGTSSTSAVNEAKYGTTSTSGINQMKYGTSTSSTSNVNEAMYGTYFCPQRLQILSKLYFISKLSQIRHVFSVLSALDPLQAQAEDSFGEPIDLQVPNHLLIDNINNSVSGFQIYPNTMPEKLLITDDPYTSTEILKYKLEETSSKIMNCLIKTKNLLCCISSAKFPDPYEFSFNGHDKTIENEIAFQSNFVRTSKYSIFSFFPKALLLQFKRLANVYFLVISILQTIPQISPLDPLTAWVPLILVLAISMLREGYQDYQRVVSDRQTNFETFTHVRRDGKFQESDWSQVVIGDIVKVQAEELFPADLILLASSTEEGIAFIQTASLDGQKNLKVRNAYPQTQKYNNEDRIDTIKGEWLGILPDKQLHKFSSQIVINGEKISFQGDKQLLYRGTRLKNTQWIYGLAIYTGRNTKIMLNSESESEKMSQIERKLNIILIFILFLQITCCIILAIFFGVFRNQVQSNSPYILWPSADITTTSTASLVGQSSLIALTYFVLINTMIPISLVVSIEVVKFAQSYFINSDQLMYSEFRKKFVQVKSASLNQELGQIEYVFSDKTGTLTMNLMEFKIAIIGQQMYGDLSLISDDPNAIAQQQKGFQDDTLLTLIKGKSNIRANPPITIKNKEGSQSMTLGTQKELAEEYLKAIALAHEVVSEKDKKGKQVYQGPSPDEITLVQAAKAMDFEFIRATQVTTTLNIRGQQKTYDLLDVFPFTSERKRMSVIIRDGGMIKMYCKGADNIMKQRVSKDQKLNLDSQLNRFSRIGLRTLLIGMRIISDEEYGNFKKAVENLPRKAKQTAMQKLISNLQNNLYLIGATAVLDRLQDDVPETIRDLIRANIKVWMLTGDKMETAENIAKSCNLIQNHFQILRYSPKEDDVPLEYLRKIVKESEELTERGIPKAFLIQGSHLSAILGNLECEIELANLAKNCEAVVGCRLLPIQKALVVGVIRTHLDKITLAIGDGANDVPMIKTAHIGIGLFGQQGMSSVQASDYALPEFRMLWRLLLVHGRWNYIRISQMILYFFYKNMLFTVPQLVFAFFNGYSGQTAYDDYYIALYNLFFTSTPLIIRAVLEQDINYFYKQSDQQLSNQIRTSAYLVSNTTLMRQNKYLPPGYKINKYLYRLFPKIYFIGQQNLVFNYYNYFMWIIEGVFEGILISIFAIYIIGQISLNQSGINSDWWIIGFVVYSAVIIVVTIKLSTHTKFWSWQLFLNILISLVLYAAYTWVSNYIISQHILGTPFVSWTTGQTYFLVLLMVCGILAIDGAVVFVDFDRGGYASKMREVIRVEEMINKDFFDNASLRFTDGLSIKPQG